MQIHPGFARLLPLMALTGLAAGTLALLASARPVQAPAPPRPSLEKIVFPGDDGGCSDVPAPVPSHGIVDIYGRLWEVADIPHHVLVGLDLRNAEWFRVDLRGACLVACDFRGTDLRAANLRGVRLWDCDFTGADLTGADLTGVKYSGLTRWPARFDPKALGARPILMRR